MNMERLVIIKNEMIKFKIGSKYKFGTLEKKNTSVVWIIMKILSNPITAGVKILDFVKVWNVNVVDAVNIETMMSATSCTLRLPKIFKMPLHTKCCLSGLDKLYIKDSHVETKNTLK